MVAWRCGIKTSCVQLNIWLVAYHVEHLKINSIYFAHPCIILYEWIAAYITCYSFPLRLLISPILFKHLDKRGIQTYLWVLNEDSEFNLAFNKLKVAGVMTDYPTRLKNYLDSGNGPPPANSSSSNEASQLIKQKW